MNGRVRPEALLLLAVVAICSLVAGCAVVEPGTGSQEHATFSEDLAICRLQHSGRTNRRIALSPYEERITECLARRGWLPSGERSPLKPGNISK